MSSGFLASDLPEPTPDSVGCLPTSWTGEMPVNQMNEKVNGYFSFIV